MDKQDGPFNAGFLSTASWAFGAAKSLGWGLFCAL